ncbi:MAG: phage tail protein [Cyanobacteria bacterium P01_F01_bin.86]
MVTIVRPSLPLKLVSLEILESGQPSPLSSSPQVSTTNHSLQVIPGRRNDLLVWIENTSGERVPWSLAINGTFPPDWCYWEQVHPVITPHSKLSQVITFVPPVDFFEHNRALVAQDSLIAYSASVSIFAHLDQQGQTDESPGQLIGYRDIDLTVHAGSTYLDFLPKIYRSDFMERFIAIFEQVFAPTVQTTDTLWAYLDPLTAPKALIPFLAQWVNWPLNSNWPLRRQRKLIKHAVELYQWRGTARGLELMLSLHTGLPVQPLAPEDGRAIEIRESHENGFVLGQTSLNQSPRLGGGKPYFFTVTLRPATSAAAREIDEALVRRVIEQEKPAFCSYHLEIVWPE